MVFSSVPPYLDPSNWQQQPPPPPPINHHHQPDHHQHPHPPPAPPPPPPHGGGSIRPGSMADRARLANIPMPEGPLKCPRCDSTNTKFCYFNNYNLSQPRHFCKTCRRYWTRGGALRNVPVGGGCRRNKRTKGGTTSKHQPSSTSAATAAAGGATSGGGNMEILGLPNLRASMAPPLQSYLTDFGSGINMSYGSGGGGEPPLGMSYGGGGGGVMERLRFTQMTSQFPFMTGSDPYGPFEGTIEPSGFTGLLPPSRPKTPSSAADVAAAAVKMENNNSNSNNNNQDLNLSRQFLGMMNSTGNDQVTWNGSGGAWKMDLSSFGSSTGNNNNNPP